ncbi:MAG TPA: hypothetical protein VKD72_35935 [Gemmataceae bacterium]|nr:hypothetical protein [Gemmataceae bacterium]
MPEPPARREELHAELGHPGDRIRETFSWDTEPLYVPLRQTPDPVGFGLALAPATGFTRPRWTIAHRCGPTTELFSNGADAANGSRPRLTEVSIPPELAC